MATKKKARTKKKLGKLPTVKCKTVRVKGQGLRKICRDRLGRITSNKKATRKKS